MCKLQWRWFGGLVVLGWIAMFWAQTEVANYANLLGAECPFCAAESIPTLVSDYKDANMVLYGYFANAKGGNVDFLIEKVLKDHEIIKGKKVITLPKDIQATNRKFVIFCSVFKGNINPYRGEEVSEGSELLKYLTIALEHKDDSVPKRLRHCFDFLDSADLVVLTDAYREFAIADYVDYKEIAKKLPAKTIAEWLTDPKTPTFRYGLYASLLGHCGDPKKDGDLLRSMLDDPKKIQGSNLDGIMAGYCMLQPKEAGEYLKKLLKNDGEEFYFRYAGLRTLRFLWDYRSEILGKTQILEAMGQAIEVPDQADFAIDDLRNWKAWDMTDKVLDLTTKASHDHKFVQRAILRFALCSPSPRAADFVRKQRQLDPELVRDTEEILRIEAPAPKVADPKKR